MEKRLRKMRERDPAPASLLIAAHCSTIQRKAKHLDTKELFAILDDFVHELNSNPLCTKIYLNSLNEIIKTLNSTFPRALLRISSHHFFSLICNTIRNLLQQLCIFHQLNKQENYTLRNCIVLIHHLVEKLDDVSKVLPWITHSTFLNEFANCLNRIDKISNKNENKHAMKQLTRLLNMFCNIQERLPIDSHRNLFVRLLQPIMNCLTSSNYNKLFANLKSNANSLTEKQKLYLIKCPYFLTTYTGPHMKKAIKQILETMLPRYVSILDNHMKTIKQWNRPLMRAIHNLITTIIYAENYFSSYTNNKSFRSLIEHFLNLINEPTIINKIRPNSNNIETLLIEATLIVFSLLVYESDALNYIKQRKPTAIFRRLTTMPDENIVLRSYMILAYTIDENDMEISQSDLSQLLVTTIDLFKKSVEIRYQPTTDPNSNREKLDRNIIQLVKTLKGLAHHEQIRYEVLKQEMLPSLIGYYKKLHGLSKELLLECLWTLSFNEEIKKQLRKHQQFILSLQKPTKSSTSNTRENVVSRSNKVVDGLLWKVVKEPLFREKFAEKMQKQTKASLVYDNQKYKYDIMISYCHADKRIVYKIHEYLTNEGYNIWFDRDHRHRHEIVAEAIENSEIVIICMSDAYKRDNRCQAEADYAYDSERFLLSLILQNDYKPDGWLRFIIRKSIHINFGTSDIKSAYALLLKEIDKRQSKNDILDVKPTVSTSGKIPPDTAIVANKKQRSPPIARSLSRLSTPESIASTEYNHVDKQQQRTSKYSLSRSSTTGSIVSITSDRTDKQQQQTPMHSISRSRTSVSDTDSMNPLMEDLQAQMRSISNSPTSDFDSPVASVDVNKQQQTIVRPVLSPFMPRLIISDSFITNNKQQRDAPISSLSRRLPTDIDTSDIPTVIDEEQQQTQRQPVSQVPVRGFKSSTASVASDKEQSRKPMDSIPQSSQPTSILPTVTTDRDKQQQQAMVRPVSRSLTPTSDYCGVCINDKKVHRRPPVQPTSRLPKTKVTSSAAFMALIEQQQKTAMPPVSRSLETITVSSVTPHVAIRDQQHSRPLTLSTISSDEPIDARKPKQQQRRVQSVPRTSTVNNVLPATPSTTVQQQQRTPTYSLSQPLKNGTSPLAASSVVSQQPPQKTLKRAVSQPLTTDTISLYKPVAIDREQRQETQIHLSSRSSTSSSNSSDECIDDSKQHQQIQPVPSTTNAQQQHQHTPMQPLAQRLTNGIPPLTALPVINPQPLQTAKPFVSEPPVTSTVPPAMIVATVRQQQQPEQQHQIPVHPNSNPTTAVAPSMHSIQPEVLQTNVREQSRLFAKYINRSTRNSTYRNISINAWGNNDVLDFLFDSNLYAIMPLCESMSGKALTRLFRMCQVRPSRLYSLLNEELRTRFNGLTLPIGAYTQFLVEMDGLVGPTVDALPPIPLTTPKIATRAASMPYTIQRQPNSSSSSRVIFPTNQPKSITPVDMLLKPAGSYGTQIFQQSISSIGTNSRTII